MANNFNDNANKKNLNGDSISYTTYRTNYPNDEAMKENGGVPSGGGSDINLEDNKTATIDVSAYTAPVEVIPSDNYDGMKKVTVTLSNIPSGGVNTLYAWKNYDVVVYTTTPTPSVGNNVIGILTEYSTFLEFATIESVSEDTITIYSTQTYTRDSQNDISLI